MRTAGTRGMEKEPRRAAGSRSVLLRAQLSFPVRCLLPARSLLRSNFQLPRHPVPSWLLVARWVDERPFHPPAALLHSGFLCGGFLSWLLSSVCFKQSPKEGAASAPGKDTCQTPGELRAAAREIKQPLTSCRMCPGLKLLFPSAFRLVPQLLVLICAEQGGVCS